MSPHQLPPLNALRAFEATARLGSASRAATELHVTHGAISRQLQLLEQHLGLALFERGGRRLQLNAAGRQLRDACAGAFSQIRTTVETLQRQQAPDALVLGCTGSILARWMIPRLQDLRRQLPQLTLHLSAQEGRPDPDLSGLDAALLLARGPWPADWQVHTLARERLGVVVSPRHPAAAQLQGQPPDALLQHEVMHTLSRPQAWPQWLQGQQLAPAQLRLGTRFDHLFYLLEAAVAGVGIAIAPEPLVAEDLAQGRLLAPWGFIDGDSDWVLCAPADRDAPRLAALAAWLRTQLAGG